MGWAESARAKANRGSRNAMGKEKGVSALGLDPDGNGAG